jgi:hypothetical protein
VARKFKKSTKNSSGKQVLVCGKGVLMGTGHPQLALFPHSSQYRRQKEQNGSYSLFIFAAGCGHCQQQNCLT